MLKIKDMNLNNVIRQGDSQPREYQLDTGNLDLNLTNKSATIRLMTADFQGIGYETTATVSSENKISFSIDDVIPAREYRLEVTVDDYVFPSRATDGQFNIDPSSHGQEASIIQIIGKDEIVREVKEQIEPFLGEIEQAEREREETHEKVKDLPEAFQNVIDETTGKDVISAPEIIAARRGKASLGEKIDEVTTQLAKTERREKAYDLVEYLSKSSSLSPLMSVKMGNPNYKYFWVNIPTSDKKGVQYQFGKDTNDDFQLLLNGDFGNLIETESITESKNNDSDFLSGVFEKGYAPNYWMSTIGNYIATDFYGTKVTFNHFANNAGGIFEAILNEGTGDERRKTISVFSETPIPVKEQTLFEDLNPQKHTIKLVFKGQDPSNPVATPRGYWYFGGAQPQYSKRTFNIYNDVKIVEPTTKLLYGYTVKEFAISARPFGSSEPFVFIPEHSHPTAFKIDEPILLLNGSVPIWNEGNIYKDIHTVQIIQKLKGIHPSDPNNPLMEIDIIQTVKNGEYNISGKIKFLRKTEIDTGYALMLGYDNTTAKKIKTGLGNEYTVKTDGSKETIPSSDNSYSIVVFNDVDSGEKANIALAMTVDNINRTQRIGELNTGGQWIEHRNTTMGKVYFQQFKNAVTEVGDVYRFSGKYIISEIPKVSRFLL